MIDAMYCKPLGKDGGVQSMISSVATSLSMKRPSVEQLSERKAATAWGFETELVRSMT